MTSCPGTPRRSSGSAGELPGAALLHLPARNHALVDGNERLGLAAVIAFHGLNGVGWL